MRKVFSDTAAEFVIAVERVFGERPRVLDGSRAVLLGELKLQLEAGERELWLIERRGALEHRLGYVAVRGSIEEALLAARDMAGGRHRASSFFGPSALRVRPRPRLEGT